MTNLLEKVLIIGFGILTLTIFFSLINPFLESISEFNKNEKKDIEIYISFINELDNAITNAIDNPEEDFLKYIEYPTNLNISFYFQYAKYDFIIGNDPQYRIFFYNENFTHAFYYDIIPKTYLLNVSLKSHLIKVQFID